jgi:hypothetical protein
VLGGRILTGGSFSIDPSIDVFDPASERWFPDCDLRLPTSLRNFAACAIPQWSGSNVHALLASIESYCLDSSNTRLLRALAQVVVGYLLDADHQLWICGGINFDTNETDTCVSIDSIDSDMSGWAPGLPLPISLSM